MNIEKYLKEISKIDKDLKRQNEKLQQEYARVQKQQKKIEEEYERQKKRDKKLVARQQRASNKQTLRDLNKQVREMKKVYKVQDKQIKKVVEKSDRIANKYNEIVEEEAKQIESTTRALMQFQIYKLKDSRKRKYNNHIIQYDGEGREYTLLTSFKIVVVPYNIFKQFRTNFLYTADSPKSEDEISKILQEVRKFDTYTDIKINELGASISIDGLIITSLSPFKTPVFKKVDLLKLKYRDDNGDKKINNKYTKYDVNKDAKNFNELFVVELNEYLKKNFRPRCCLLTALINAYYDRFNRKKSDGKRRNKELTYEYLCEVLEVENQPSDIGVDIYTVIEKFIKTYKFLSFYVYDAYTNLLVSHVAEDSKDSVSLRILLKDGHVYQLNNDLKSLQQLSNVSEFNEIIVNDKYNLMDFEKQKADVKFFYSMEELLQEIVNISLIEKSDIPNIKLITSISLTEVLLELLKSKYTPQIYFQNFIYKVSLVVNKIIVSIEIADSNPIYGEDVHINDIETYNLYHGEFQKLYTKVIDKEYMSEYHPTVKQIHEQYKILPPVGYINHSLKKCSIIDQNKAYSHKLANIDYVPVFKYFDVYEQYKGEKVEDYTYYIIEVLEEKETTKLIFESKFCRVFGFVLKSINENIKIHYFRKPLEIKPANFKTNIDELYNNEKLSMSMKKTIANKITGIMEIGSNKKYLTKIFEDYNEAENYRVVMNGRIIPLATYKNVESNNDDGLDFGVETKETQKFECIDKIHGYLVNVDQKKEQCQGFKPMKDIIYLRQKLEMYNLYNKLQSLKVPVFGMRTDCFYIDSNHVKTIKNNKQLFNLGKEIGQFKIENIKVSPDVKLEMKINELVQIDNFEPIIKTFEDEKDTKTINEYLNNNEPVLIKGLYAGVGKSTLCKNFDKYILFVLPYNKLCQKVQIEGFDARTYSKLFNLIFDDQELKKVSIDNKDITSYKTICFDEALLYTPDRLKRIAKFINEHPDIKVIATGDTDQRNPIGFDNSEYLNKCMNIIFKNQILLKDIKRLNNEKDKQRMKQLKEDIFNYKLSIEEICKRNNIKTVKYMDEITTLKNICYFNFRCNIVSNHIHHNILKHDVKFFEGLKIICRVYEKSKTNHFQTNYEYKITKMTKTNITILNEADNESQNITMKQLQNNFILPYAFTCDSIQGDSFEENEKATIFDTNIPHTDRKYFWTGITRVRNLNDIQVFIHSDNEVGKLTKSKMNQYYNMKVDSYKQQDKIAKRDYDCKLFVNAEWIIQECEKLKYTCKYCSSGLQIYINDSIVESNITVNRIDNSLPHHISNSEICCLHCNVSRK